MNIIKDLEKMPNYMRVRVLRFMIGISENKSDCMKIEDLDDDNIYIIPLNESLNDLRIGSYCVLTKIKNLKDNEVKFIIDEEPIDEEEDYDDDYGPGFSILKNYDKSLITPIDKIPEKWSVTLVGRLIFDDKTDLEYIKLEDNDTSEIHIVEATLYLDNLEKGESVELIKAYRSLDKSEILIDTNLHKSLIEIGLVNTVEEYELAKQEKRDEFYKSEAERYQSLMEDDLDDPLVSMTHMASWNNNR